MRLTTKARYAVIALVDLASHADNAPVSLASIAERQDISGAYLEQLFLRLRKRGVVKGMRGPGGGYILSRPASGISIAEVIRAVDEPLISHVDLSETLPLPGSEGISIQDQVKSLWAGLGLHVFNYLDSISLADVGAGRVTQPFSMTGENAGKPMVSCAFVEGGCPYVQERDASAVKCDA